MKSLILISIFQFFFAANLQQKQETINWSADRKLTWKDFEAMPDTKSDNAAITNTNIQFRIGYSNNKINYQIDCVFDKTKSWGKVKTDFILSHEQGHFDIAEIHARLLHKRLLAYTFNNESASKDVNRFFATAVKEMTDMQDVYDTETDYSRNKEVQLKWKDKITALLKSTSAYSNYKNFSAEN